MVVVMTGLAITMFLASLDNTIVTTALPTITAELHGTASDYSWTGVSYVRKFPPLSCAPCSCAQMLASGACIPLWGKLSDVFGRKPIILLANSVFLVGSIMCAVSTSAEMLVAGRSVQGLGGGGINVLVYVCVADLFVIRYVLHTSIFTRS